MLQESELLVTIAQVAIGLAGFSGVAGVIGERTGSTVPAVQGALLRLMIESSLLAAGFSLLPIVLFHVGCAPELLWRLAAAISLLAFTAQFGLAMRRGLRIIRAGAGQPRAWGAAVTLIAVAVMLLLGAATLGFASSSFYVAALFLQVVLSGGSFVRFFAFLVN